MLKSRLRFDTFKRDVQCDELEEKALRHPGSHSKTLKITQHQLDNHDVFPSLHGSMTDPDHPIESLQFFKVTFNDAKSNFVAKVMEDMDSQLTEMVFFKCRMRNTDMRIIQKAIKERNKNQEAVKLQSLIFEEIFIPENTAKVIGDLLADC